MPMLAPTFMMRGWSYAAEDVGGPRLADELDARRWNFPPPRPGPWPGIIPSYPPFRHASLHTVLISMGGYSSVSRQGGNKEFLVILRKNTGILRAREQTFQ